MDFGCGQQSEERWATPGFVSVETSDEIVESRGTDYPFGLNSGLPMTVPSNASQQGHLIDWITTNTWNTRTDFLRPVTEGRHIYLIWKQKYAVRVSFLIHDMFNS